MASIARAFTLIELLVVIAIIAILAGILFPVFARAREQSYKSACASNQRQLVDANVMYADDYERYVPAAQDYMDWDSGAADTKRWFGTRGPDGRFTPKNGPLVPYLKDGGLLRKCPAFNPRAGWDIGTGGYVYNYVGVGSLVWELGYSKDAFHSSRKTSGISRPVEVAMFSDGGIDAGTGSGIVEDAFMEPPPPVSRLINSQYSLDPTIHFRHNGTALVAFVDGHVAPRKVVLSADSSPVFPGADPSLHGLGWIGPTDVHTPYDPAP